MKKYLKKNFYIYLNLSLLLIFFGTLNSRDNSHQSSSEFTRVVCNSSNHSKIKYKRKVIVFKAGIGTNILDKLSFSPLLLTIDNVLNNATNYFEPGKNADHPALAPIIIILTFLIRIIAFFVIFTFYNYSITKRSWLLISGAFLLLSMSSLYKLYLFFDAMGNQVFRPLELILDLLLSVLLLIGIIYFSKILRKSHIIERQKQAAEDRFRNIFNNSTDMVIVIDEAGNIEEVNRTMCEKLGFPKAELLTRHFKSIRSASELSESISEMMERTKSKHHFSMETEFYDKQNRAIPVEINCRQIDLDNKPHVLCMGRDITERKEIEKKILNTIIHTEEKERSRFAKELHDGLGPLLSSIKLYINEMGSEDLSLDDKIKYARYTEELLNEAVRNTREISNNLTPKVITDYGLVKALSSFCHKINHAHQIHIDFDHERYTERLEEQVELNLYRIITELVNNTLKHAGARNVEIVLEHQYDKISLQYSDDGRGFDFENVVISEDRGMGLRNILSRIRSLNGHYQVLPAENGIRLKFIFSVSVPSVK